MRCLIYLSFLLLFLRCGKEEKDYSGPYEISGTLTDYHTGKPIENVTVNLFRTKYEGARYYKSIPVLTFPDSLGHYSLKFTANNEGNVTYEVLIQNFINGTQPVVFMKSGKSTMDIQLKPYGYIEYTIGGTKNGSTMTHFYNGNSRNHYKHGDTATVKYPKYPLQNHLIRYIVYDSAGNQLYEKNDQVYIEPRQTVQYAIEF